MAETSIKEPIRIAAGDTFTWKRSFPNYPASGGWTLTYALVNSSALIEITASADDDDFLVSIAAATTAVYTAGTYDWQAYVTKDLKRYQVDSGVMEILPNFAAAESGLDARSHVKKVLDALEAMIEGKASQDQLSYAIGGRSISKLSPQEVIDWRDAYAQMYQRELRKLHGQGERRTVKVKFS